ncbi:hypothetical protein HPSH465_1040 [Glaesserella parasuis H465]|nr:hypothetical protein HPSH465_1040 [Glaesserella parasuis H465]
MNGIVTCSDRVILIILSISFHRFTNLSCIFRNCHRTCSNIDSYTIW